MPNEKKVDAMFEATDGLVPCEAKGQWNRELWTASGSQLDALYLRDARTQGLGIYLVYWFGPDVPSKFRRKPPPGGGGTPANAEELQAAPSAHLSPDLRDKIIIMVLDFTGSSRNQPRG